MRRLPRWYRPHCGVGGLVGVGPALRRPGDDAGDERDGDDDDANDDALGRAIVGLVGEWLGGGHGDAPEMMCLVRPGSIRTMTTNEA